jgi:hypothetical protein
MADKVDKPKKAKAKPKKDEKGVLAALPSTRPERIGTRRANGKASNAKSTTTKSANGRASSAKKTPSATATRRKAAAPRTFEPTEAAESAAGAADERAAGAAATPPTGLRPAPEPRPRAVREGAPGMGTTSGERPTGEREQPSPEHGRPSGVELVTTAVQAAGELTQIGLTIGGQIIKRAVDRLPKP